MFILKTEYEIKIKVNNVKHLTREKKVKS